MATQQTRSKSTSRPRLHASRRVMDWVLWMISLIGPMSVDELVQLSGLPRTTITNAVRGLISQGLLVRVGFRTDEDPQTGDRRKGDAYYHLTDEGWWAATSLINSTAPTGGSTSKGTGLPHQAGINRTLIALFHLMQAEQRQLVVTGQRDALDETGIIDWQGYRFASRFYERWQDKKLLNPQRIRPDAMVSMAFRNHQYELRIELDRGTEGPKILREKVERYIRELTDKGGFVRRHEAFPVNILWVIDDPRSARRAGLSRVDQIINILYEVLTEKRRSPDAWDAVVNDSLVVDHRHWVAALQDLESATSLDDPLWFDPFDDELKPRPSTIWTPVTTAAQIVDAEFPRRLLLN